MKHVFIINPVAGDGKIQKSIVNSIDTNFKNKSIDYEVYYTKCKGDIETYLQDKLKEIVPTVFYACGGDGTLHEVVNAVVRSGSSFARVGVIPCGSGNDFVKNFNKDCSFLDIAAQISGQTVSLDLLKVQNEYAVSVCNMGLDADAAANMHKFKKVPFISGSTRYYLSVLYCLINKLGKNLEVIIDNSSKLNGSYLLGVLANGHSYGGGYKCAPKAVINDGIMDLCFVSKLSRLKIMNLIGSYKLGEHLNNPKISKYITYLKCQSVIIKSNEPLNICIDGEIYSHRDVNVTVVKNALQFWLPEGAEIQEKRLSHI